MSRTCRMHPALAVAALLALAAVPAAAQAPRITKLGDASVRTDSLLKLAIDPKERPDDATHLILDDGVIILDAQGKGTRTFRQVRQVLKREAIEESAEHSWGYLPEREAFVLNWARVYSRSGKLVSAKPAVVQEGEIPAREIAPVYQKQRVYRMSLAGVTEGSIIDISWSYKVTSPSRAGDFLEGWRLHAGTSVARSRYVVELPAAMDAKLVARNMGMEPKVQQLKAVGRSPARVVRMWAAADIPKLEPEPLAADSNDVVGTVTLAGTGTWEDVGRWYAGLAKGRDSLTPAVTAKLRELVKDARTQEDSIRAIHRWVAQDIRYVSVSLGLGGYQPRTPQAVMADGFGDCKDKATLFVAALRWMGVPAWPVLLNAIGRVDTAFVSINQFNHVIAALDRGRGAEFADLTADLVPFGELPPNVAGQFGLVVRDLQRIDRVTLPDGGPAANSTVETIAGTLTPTGQLTVALTQSGTGAGLLRLRAQFPDGVDAKAREGFAKAAAQNFFANATPDSLLVSEGRDFTQAPRFALFFKAPQVAKRAGDSWILTLKPPAMGRSFAQLADAIERKTPRRFPIDLRDTFGRTTSVTESRIRLPDGWTAQLPDGVKAVGAPGTFEVTYAQEGNTLVVRRTLRPADRGVVLPPSAAGEVLAWLREAAKDETDFVVLRPR
ncbi:MAG: DUF3857 domain-containing protein [Gemmatimonadales bacterium]|nr:DUF3857 domain-containing protein [Gemmatimonadales bacterium]